VLVSESSSTETTPPCSPLPEQSRFPLFSDAERKQRMLEASRRWRQLPANREKQSASTADWRKRNPEKVLAKLRRWRVKHPELKLEQNRRHYYRDVAHSRFLCLRKCCPRRGLIFALDRDVFVAWWNATPDVCTYCRLTLAEVQAKFANRPKRYRQQMSVDRVDPSRGYEQDNIVKACYACNIEKGDKYEKCRRRKSAST
jgi:hypothetical protein